MKHNTFIFAILSNTVNAEGHLTDRYLKKLESVLDYCKKQDSVTLLWRPHPLLEQTFRSMRPQLYERYQRLVQDYKEAGFGIYDESADLHRAIELAGAYYGDGSSVLTLWKKRKNLVLYKIRKLSITKKIYL